MAYKRKSEGVCRGCGETFPVEWVHQKYCNLRCAWFYRVDRRGSDECWPWRGGRCNGYGIGTFNGEPFKVSRLVLAEKLGRDLLPKMYALHTCDNPICCNPAHLWEGTNADNMIDKTAKGRCRSISPKLRGEAHGRAKLTEEAVLFMRANKHLGPKALGDRFGVKCDVAYKVLHGITWKHLPM